MDPGSGTFPSVPAPMVMTLRIGEAYQRIVWSAKDEDIDRHGLLVEEMDSGFKHT